MSKHTPGPWHQCGDEILAEMGDRCYLVATVADWSEDTERYARLIAAAPALLEALKMIAGAAPCVDNLMSDKDIARAAIKAAEGEEK